MLKSVHVLWLEKEKFYFLPLRNILWIHCNIFLRIFQRNRRIFPSRTLDHLLIKFQSLLINTTQQQCLACLVAFRAWEEVVLKLTTAAIQSLSSKSPKQNEATRSFSHPRPSIVSVRSCYHTGINNNNTTNNTPSPTSVYSFTTNQSITSHITTQLNFT